VKSVGDGTFTLSQWRGRTATIDTSSSTAYYQAAYRHFDPSSASTSTGTTVQPGEFVAAYGVPGSTSGVLDASIVDIFSAPHPFTAPSKVTTASATRPKRPGRTTPPPPWTTPTTAPTTSTAPSSTTEAVVGTVTSVDGDVITLTQAGTGATWTVTTTTSTAYNDDPCGPASSSDPVADGDTIKVVGAGTGTDALTASVIDVYSPRGNPGGVNLAGPNPGGGWASGLPPASGQGGYGRSGDPGRGGPGGGAPGGGHGGGGWGGGH
jgi:hypothetical protein